MPVSRNYGTNDNKTKLDVEIFGFPVCVIRSRRREKTISIQVSDSEILVRVPFAATKKHIETLLTSYQGWIQKTIEKRQDERKQEKNEIQQTWRTHLLYQGKPLCLRIQNSPSWKMEYSENELFIQTPAEDDCLLQEAVRAWYRNEAETLIRCRVELWARRLEAQYNDIRIKEHKSRWGSCSSLRNLNFNWRLVAAPRSVLDYVIVHELCHLWEMNHSKRFWQRVEEAFPGYRDSKQWLREHGKSLYFSLGQQSQLKRQN